MTCAITGTAILPTGAVLASASIEIRPAAAEVWPSGGALVAPDRVTVSTGPGGAVSFALMPGRYRGTSRTTTGQARFLFTVPDQSTADLAALIAAG